MRAERSTLLTFAAAVFLPLVLFVVLQAGFSLQMQRGQIEAQAMARAREVNARIDGQLWADRSALQILTTGPLFVAHDWPGAYERVLRAKRDRPRWKNLILTDAATGREIWQTAVPLGAVQPARPSVRAYLGDKTADIKIDGLSSAGPPCPCLTLHAPVIEKGKVVFVLSLELGTDDFQAILMANHQPDGISAVVDDQGRFVARTLDYEKKVGLQATPYVRNAMKTGMNGLYRGKTWEGLENYTAFETSPFSGLSTHVAIDASLVNAPQRGFLAMMGLAAVTTLLLAAAIGGYGLRQLALRREEDERRRHSQKLEVLGQLAGGISHDFNNLLAVIIGNLQRLTGKVGDDAARPIANALAAAERGKKLTQQLLTFTRVQPVEIETVDLSEVLDSARDLIAQSVGSGVQVAVDVEPDARHFRTNASELELALMNLAVNARDAMPDGGLIEIRARRATAEVVELSVRDSGHGMSKPVAERAFEPFFTTKPPGKGTGLGLAQVYSLAAHSGGGVHIESIEGGGTTVTMRFPAASTQV